MKINRGIKKIIALPLLSITSLLFSLCHPVLAKTELTEIDDFCFRYRHNSLCKDKESYISLETWKKNKTVCSLTMKWQNEEKKCKISANDNELTIYVENGLASEYLSETYKTKIIKIQLDEIFAFDTQWWLADVEVNRSESERDGKTTNSLKTTKNAVGIFTDLQIGFIQNVNNNSRENSHGEFLTISAKNLHQILEQMEAWRYYLPDLTTFEQQFKPKSVDEDKPKNVSKNIAKLKETNECSDCDLRNADLAGLDLEKANLQGANLTGANLAETKLKQAYLLGANLNQANLAGANLERANLMFASLSEANLFEAKLKGANLQNTELNNADLSEAELKAQDLKVTSLKNANLNGAKLINADLRCVNLQSANLKNADLTNADLSPCVKKKLTTSFQLSNLRLSHTGVPYTFFDELSNAVSLISGIVQAIENPNIGLALNFSIPTINYHLSSNLSGANLSGANLTDVDLSGVNLTDINLSNVILLDAKLSANSLSNASFINTDVSEVDFKNPILICNAIFSDESIYEEHCQEDEEEEEKEEEKES